MNPYLGLAQLLLIGLCLWWVVLVVYTIRGLTHPPRQTYASAISKGIPGDPGELDEPRVYQEHTIVGSRGKISLWDIVGGDPNGPIIIMTHGWGSSKIGGLKRINPFARHASRVILWDLPGHGESEGSTKLGSKEHEDLRCVITWADTDRPVVLVGWSMGAGISLAYANQCAEDQILAGIVCEAPYIRAITPARNVIRLRGVPTRFNLPPAIGFLGFRFGIGARWDGFARDQHARGIRAPIVILHGTDDPVCPIADSEQIARLAQNARLVKIAQGGHNNLWTDPVFRQEMIETMNGFFAQIDPGAEVDQD